MELPMKRSYLFLALAVCIAIIVVLAYWCLFSPTTTILLVRHAERLNPTDTTSLSAGGFERASELEHAVGSAGINYIIISDKQRTAQTAAPTAASLGITPVGVPASDIDGTVDSIKAHAGQVILLVGHADTLPRIIADLGISPPPGVGENEFDRLFVITKNRWRTSLIMLKYGKPT
jgi:phosphohistidine phosphatase SixA